MSRSKSDLDLHSSRSSGECSHDLGETVSHSRDRRYEEQAFLAKLQRFSETVMKQLGLSHRLKPEKLSIHFLDPDSYGSAARFTYTVHLSHGDSVNETGKTSRGDETTRYGESLGFSEDLWQSTGETQTK